MFEFKTRLDVLTIWLFFLAFHNILECGKSGSSIPVKTGGWYSKVQCPSGTFVKAVRLGVAKRGGLTAGRGSMRVEIDPVGYSDENGLRNLEVYCTWEDQIDRSRPTKPEYTLDESFSSLSCPGNTYATGYGLFHTKDKFSNGNPKSNVWYLGPHTFVNSSTSSLHLFCGQSYGGNGADFYFGKTPQPDVVGGCTSAAGIQNKVICQLEPRNWLSNNQDSASPEWNLAASCCFTDPLVCYGTTDYPVIQTCSNTDPDSTTDLTCEYLHTAELRNDGGPSFFGFMEDDSNAADFSSIDRWSNGNLNSTLGRSSTVIVDGFGKRENFRTVLQPEVRSPSENPNFTIISRKLSFKVKPGRVGRVRQLRGSCGGTAYSIYASIYEVSFRDRQGNRVNP